MNNNEIYKENSKKTFNSQAKAYDQTYYGKHARDLYQIVIKKVKELNPKSLLDIGCGTGNILSTLSKKESIELYGIDLSEEMLKEAKKKLNGMAELKIGDSENLPWDSETFESVICTDSFHHYPRAEEVLNQVANVLKNKGKIIIGDPWLPAPFRQIANVLIKFGQDGDYRIYSKSEITKLLFKCGFRNILWERVNCKSFVVTAEVNK